MSSFTLGGNFHLVTSRELCFLILITVCHCLSDLWHYLMMSSLLGSITVIAGLYILLWGKNKEMQNCVAKVSQGTEEIKDQEPSSQVDIL